MEGLAANNVEIPYRELMGRPSSPPPKAAASSSSGGSTRQQMRGPVSRRRQGSGTKEEAPAALPWHVQFARQELRGWQPVYTPLAVLGTLTVLSLVCLALGLLLLLSGLQVSTYTLRYDNAGPLANMTAQQRQRAVQSAGDAGIPVDLHLQLPEGGSGLASPSFLAYRITGFYPAHKRFVRSVSRAQLEGRGRKHRHADHLDSCKPRKYLGGAPNASLPQHGLMRPCGLMSWSLFNDTFQVFSSCPVVTTADSSRNRRSSNEERSSGDSSHPSSEQLLRLRLASGAGGMDCGSNSSDSSWGEQGCSDAAGTPDMSAPAALPSPSDAMSAAAAAVAHAVRLDEAGIIDMRDFQQMYGMWGEVLNHNTVPALRGGGALQGPPGQDPHFVTWMTAGAHPSLEHPYAVIRDNIPPGCTLRIRVANRYNTYGFEGHKSLVLFSTAPALLGRASNTFLGILYLALAAGFAGAVCALLTIVLRHRRRLGEAELLSWNQHT